MKHKMAIIGFGSMGQWHYENITARIGQIEVVGAYDIKAEVREKIAGLNLKAYENVEQLLQDSDTDIVLVATPNNFHMHYSILAMKAGKHVVCEKPVTMDSQELDQIIEVKNQTGKHFTVHQNRRWDIDYSIVKNVISQNTIGKPYFIDSRLFGSKGLPGDWRSAKEAGGGMLYDWGVHLIDQILYLIKSNVKSVYAELVNVKFPEVDDCCRVLINFENGVKAQVVVNTWCYIGDYRWHISCDDGTLMLNDWLSCNGKMIKANIKEINWEEGVIFTSNGRSKTMAPRPKEDLQELPLPAPAAEPRWEEFYENFIDVIDKGAKALVTIDEIKNTMKVLDACFLSAIKNKVIHL